MTILGKKQMSEEDIKLNYITPVILNGWKGHMTMETKITDGRINISGNIVARSKPKFADYMLYLNDGKPIAVVEAKDNNHSVSHGLQQAMTYAQMMDLPFAYSSNGDAFYEHDFFTGQERQIVLEQFPTQDELVARYYAELNGGKGVSDLEKKIVSQPYYSSQSTYPPRYYQRNAVNRTVEAIARGQQRLLLVMATGTGKTYTAFQIVYRLLIKNSNVIELNYDYEKFRNHWFYKALGLVFEAESKINMKKYRIELTQMGQAFVSCCFEKQNAESDSQKQRTT